MKYYRVLGMPIALFATAALGCTSSPDSVDGTAHHAKNERGTRNITHSSSATISIEGQLVRLTADESEETSTWSVNYTRDTRGLDDEQALMVERASNIRSVEHHLLVVFLYRQLLEHVAGSSHHKRLSISLVDSSMPRDDIGQYEWFIEPLRGVEWCTTTLAWRSRDGTRVEFLKRGRDCDGKWVQMTRNTFYRWYDALDDQNGFHDVFAGRCRD